MYPEKVFTTANPEVAGRVLAGMPWHWCLAGELKFRLNVSEWVTRPLETKLWDIAVRMKNQLGWKTHKGDIGKAMLRQLARLAICEMLAPVRFSAPDAWQLRAAFIGVGKSQWFSVWSGRYGVLFDEFNEWANRANSYNEIKSNRSIDDAKEMAKWIVINEKKWLDVMFNQVA